MWVCDSSLQSVGQGEKVKDLIEVFRRRGEERTTVFEACRHMYLHVHPDIASYVLTGLGGGGVASEMRGKSHTWASLLTCAHHVR
jgi:hypothetical protein